MLIIVGILVTLGMVFGGYILAGGAMEPILYALPIEGMMIGGAGLGSFLTGNGGSILKKAGSGLGKAFKGPKWNADDYKDILCLLFMISKLIKTKGVIALEAHIENPQESKIFNHVGRVKDDHHITDFICDYFRMTTMNFDDPHQFEDVMLKDLEKHHHEESEGAHALAILGEAFPALGIVAAVLGIVKTMGAINEPVDVLGGMIGSALVGTFLGILVSYTMASPLASRLQQIIDEEGHVYDVMKDFIIAHLQGNAPQIASEIARRAVPHDFQPSFYELDEVLQEIPNDVFA
ncbi:flagellar motor stator protein MotA [Pseudemcibacter aquimaris]|uniref:flagellar motor stator protein MotA n=1 Tax=Pseudemcibacter aquimaris TaxID=2857064 RepID=UPI0020120140|nr:flagellar motor stator protein MotA [Pseudemcibacter aquimaris]MCC3860590.1 flagellar motor stator protein MotA [Pseudemcibacter aquimaris]WDU59411.1 flagellar motor stator protein MotA [Pseudemcibacter aquimaris]